LLEDPLLVESIQHRIVQAALCARKQRLILFWLGGVRLECPGEEGLECLQAEQPIIHRVSLHSANSLQRLFAQPGVPDFE